MLSILDGRFFATYDLQKCIYLGYIFKFFEKNSIFLKKGYAHQNKKQIPLILGLWEVL